jgi:hypothetical protein
MGRNISHSEEVVKKKDSLDGTGEDTRASIGTVEETPPLEVLV